MSSSEAFYWNQLSQIASAFSIPVTEVQAVLYDRNPATTTDVTAVKQAIVASGLLLELQAV